MGLPWRSSLRAAAAITTVAVAPSALGAVPATAATPAMAASAYVLWIVVPGVVFLVSLVLSARNHQNRMVQKIQTLESYLQDKSTECISLNRQVAAQRAVINKLSTAHLVDDVVTASANRSHTRPTAKPTTIEDGGLTLPS